MGIGLVVVIGIVVIVVIAMVNSSTRGFDDPKPMTNEHLLSAIAGQADWLEKVKAAPIESQQSASIVALVQKRKGYIAQLCLEAVSRASLSEGSLKYPGATIAINAFTEAAQHAKTLEATGVSKENSAIRAVKEKLFKENGVNYPAGWEL